MANTAVVTVVAPLFDEARLAVAGFLARYSGPTRVSYTCDLRQWFTWCANHSLPPFAAGRGHLELWARDMEAHGRAASTVARHLSTVAGFYRFAVIDGLVEHSTAEFVRRSKIDTESTTLA